ncbi:putative transcription factor WD40-like family [Helianthus anomalus]
MILRSHTNKPHFRKNQGVTLLASCSYDLNVIVWKEGNPNEWTQLHTFSDHESSVNSIAWAPHELGHYLACGAQTMTPGALVGSGGAFEPVQNLASGGCDNIVKVWKLSNGIWKMDCFPALQMHSVWVRAVVWAPNLGLPKSTNVHACVRVFSMHLVLFLTRLD